jgi:beta-glucosidase
MEDLWDVLVHITAEVENTGAVTGAEFTQLYLGIPGAPVRQLRGYSKVNVYPGQAVTVEFHLTRRDLSVWDTTAQKWQLQRGTYNVHVGASSRKLPLAGTLTI